MKREVCWGGHRRHEWGTNPRGRGSRLLGPRGHSRTRGRREIHRGRRTGRAGVDRGDVRPDRRARQGNGRTGLGAERHLDRCLRLGQIGRDLGAAGNQRLRRVEEVQDAENNRQGIYGLLLLGGSCSRTGRIMEASGTSHHQVVSQECRVALVAHARSASRCPLGDREDERSMGVEQSRAGAIRWQPVLDIAHETPGEIPWRFDEG